VRRIVTRYYRATTAHGVAGSGIGHSEAKAIVEQHGGSIAIESAIGAGPTVSVTLPAPTDATMAWRRALAWHQPSGRTAASACGLRTRTLRREGAGRV